MINKSVGQKIRLLRENQGLSQIELAGKIGVSFQQVQKYEKGRTDISVSRLKQIADAMGVPINAFFEENEGTANLSDHEHPYTPVSGFPPLLQQLDAEERSFLKLFRRIESGKIKDGMLRQMKGVVELQKQVGRTKKQKS